MENISVLVTGVGGGGHGEQIIKALRLGKIKYEIVGTDITPYSSGLKVVDYPYIVPPANDDYYINAILKLCKKHKIRALFHGSEQELKIISSNRTVFYDAGIFLPINPPEVIELCMSKGKTCEFLQNNGFQYPSFMITRSINDIKGFNDFPIVVKPSVGGGGSSFVFIAQDSEMLKFYTEQILSISEECIVQSYIGNVEEEYTVGILHDMDGEFINSIAVRRKILTALSNRIKIPNKTNKKDLGNTLAISSGISQGEIGPFPYVTSTCEKIALSLGVKGPINIQCRYYNGNVFVFEINPRFSGTTSLRAMVGYNEPDILIRKHVLGENISPRFSYKSGYIARSLNETFIDTRFIEDCCKING